MSSFTDKHGRPWSIEFTLGSLTRVKAETGVDLLTLHVPDSPALTVLRNDPVTLLQVLLVQLRPQLREKGVGDDAFADSILEEHVWSAVEALLTGMIDYYPPAKRVALQPLLMRVISAARNVRDRTTQQVTTALAGMDLDQLQQQIERSISGSITGSSPGSSDSTPAR